MAVSLDTEISRYLHATSSLPLPARFYRPPPGLEPYVDQSIGLIQNYERVGVDLPINDIAIAYTYGRRSGDSAIARKMAGELRALGELLMARYREDTQFRLYGEEQYEVDVVQWKGLVRRQKEYELLLSKTITTVNRRIMGYPSAEVSKGEILESNILYDVTWAETVTSDPRLVSRDFTAQPITKGARITPDDALDVYALLSVTPSVPYISYHTPTSNQYKVSSTPGSWHPRRDEFTFDTIVKSDLYVDIQGTTGFITMMVRGHFIILDLLRSMLTLYTVKEAATHETLQELTNTLSFLSLSNERRLRISMRFLVLKHNVLYPIMYASLLLQEPEYIFFKEEDKPQLLKESRVFYLAPLPRVVSPDTGNYLAMREFRVNVFNHVTVNRTLVTLTNSTTQTLEVGDHYIEVLIDDVNNTSMLTFIGSMLMKLFGRLTQPNLEREYRALLGSSFDIMLGDTNVEDVYKKRKVIELRNIDYLHHKWPDVFARNYSRQCQTVQQPTVKELIDADEASSGQWLRYPPSGTTEFYFTCVNNPGHRYPGVLNSNLRFKARYPFLPCCFKQDRMLPGTLTTVAYSEGVPTAGVGSERGSLEANVFASRWGDLTFPPKKYRAVMSEDKPLYPARMGVLPVVLDAMLKSLIAVAYPDTPSDVERLPDEEEEPPYEVYRYGLVEPTMVHALFLAMDPDYQRLSTETKEQRRAYISTHVKLPHMEALSQELVNTTPEELLRDPQSWTTTEHYRILEELFGVNIFVLTRISAREGSTEPTRYYFEIPAKRAEYHLRRRITRPCVVLYKHLKYEGDQRSELPMELVLFGRELDQLTAVFGGAVCPKLFDYYEQSYSIVTFGFDPVDLSTAYGGYKRLFSLDYTQRLKGVTPTSQLIDEYGHCRGLNYDGQGFSVVFYPTQPYNLPEGQLNYADYGDVRRMFGAAGLASSKDDGVFYILGGSGTYMFVPTRRHHHAAPSDVTRVAYTPLSGEHRGSTVRNRWGKALSTLRIILFFVAWLYELSGLHSPLDFLDRHATLDEARHAPLASEIYNFTQLKRTITLPRPTLAAAFAYIHTVAPSLLASKDRVLVTSKRIWSGLLYYLRIVESELESGKHREPSRVRWNISALFTLRDTSAASLDVSSLNFISATAVKTWFQSPVTTVGETSAKIVLETIRNESTIIWWIHPVSHRIWLIPGSTYTYEEAVRHVMYWHSERRIVRALEVADDDAYKQRRNKTIVIQYGATIDNRLEVTGAIGPQTSGRVTTGDVEVVEVLLSGPARYTPLYDL